jgi:aminoglycoside phosphotransferase (APT) family kinase protein
MKPEEMRERLAIFVARESGASAVRVEGLRKVPGGASRETWSFDAVLTSDGGEKRLPLILRRDPGSDTNFSTGRGAEFRVLRAALEAGVPVPVVHWLGESADDLGAPFFIMQRIDGETLARRLLRDDQYAAARRVMTEQLAAIAARIHAVDCAGLDFLLAPETGTSPALAEVERYEQLYRAITPEPHPVFEVAFRWLHANLPEPGRSVLVHGDYRIGNVIFGAEGVRSILDWEIAHIGDPAEDLGWLCVRAWRFGSEAGPVGGIGRREELLDAYRRAGGEMITPGRLRFWELFGNLKWAVICIAQAKTHLDGRVRSVELAAIGRRTAETELELLDLLET